MNSTMSTEEIVFCEICQLTLDKNEDHALHSCAKIKEENKLDSNEDGSPNMDDVDQGYYNTGWFNPEMRSRTFF